TAPNFIEPGSPTRTGLLHFQTPKPQTKGTTMITLEANYSKKIGLPQYSSHQFSITLRSEITDLSKVQDESARLYDELQHAVDTSIQQVGFLPGENGNGKHTSGQSNR